MANLGFKKGYTCFNNSQIREFLTPQTRLKFLAPINKTVLNPLIEKYQSDKWVKTLFTAKFISLYVFIGLAIGKTVSLRLIEAISKSSFAQWFSGLVDGVSRSGLSDRNEAIPADLFRELAQSVANQAGRNKHKLISRKDRQIKIFDSTFISLAHKLIPWACQSLNKGLTSLTIRINEGSWIPDKIIIRNEPCDNTVFDTLIDWSREGITYLFDRGFSACEVFRLIIESKNFFITRLPNGYVYDIIKELKIGQTRNDSIRLLHDQNIRLGGKNRKKSFLARLITAVNSKGEMLYFLTNRFDLTALEVCEIYRQRWEIEILFRWLKTQLKIDKVIAYTENGFYVQIYMGLIFHLLIILYHRQSRHNGLTLLETYRKLQAWIFDYWGYFMFMLGIRIRNGIVSIPKTVLETGGNII